MTAPQVPRAHLVEVAYPTDRELPVADATNYSHFAQAGFDVLFSIGQVDISRLAAAQPSEQGKIRMDARVTHRFMMSLGTFVQMRQLMDDLARNMAQQGIKLPEPFAQENK